MESAKVSECKDRFIKGSISNLPEHFTAKWEMDNDCDCFMYDEQDSMGLDKPSRNKTCHCNAQLSTEDDENKIYRAMLQSEVLQMGTNKPMYKDSELTRGVNPYSLIKYSSMNSTEYLADKPLFLRTKEKIPKAPFKVLDAPALKDDFYLNLIDWSTENILAVGLGSCIYLWNASTSKVTKLYDLGNTDIVTSVAWSENGQYLGVGTNAGLFQLWDPEECKLIKTLSGHESRIGAVSWND